MCVRMTMLILVVSGLLAGCSGGGKKIPTASVTGEVKRMSGEPIGKVKVVFYPKSGPTTVTTADDGGKFTATVALGECRVAVVSGSEAKSPDMSPKAVAAAAAGDSKVASRFASPDSSGLTTKIQEKQSEKLVFVVQ